jgi:hypothetical protein
MAGILAKGTGLDFRPYGRNNANPIGSSMPSMEVVSVTFVSISSGIGARSKTSHVATG